MDKQDIDKVQKRLLLWYRQHRRSLPWRETGDPYRIWLSEVMLQQTQVATVIPYYHRFLEEFPDLQSLATADQQQVLKMWEGLGYYARARNFHRAAKIVAAEHGGRVPSDWETFKKLPGVGDYIAAAVLSIAFQSPYAVVDGNVKRVLARLLRLDGPVNLPSSHKTYSAAARKLLYRDDPSAFNQAVMELGAIVCTPKHPKCGDCPVRSACKAYRTGSVDAYPKRTSRPPVPQHHIAVGVVSKNDRLLITRRKPEGLLGGLWEFPGGKVAEKESPQQACIREITEEVSLKVRIDEHLTRVRHAYTHFKIVMDVFCCQYVSGRVKLNGPADHRWIRIDEIEAFAFPKANHKFIPALRKKYAEGRKNRG